MITTGFGSQSHFGSHFKRLVCVTPKQYIQDSKNAIDFDVYKVIKSNSIVSYDSWRSIENDVSICENCTGGFSGKLTVRSIDPPIAAIVLISVVRVIFSLAST
jgi:hypothetical protein